MPDKLVGTKTVVETRLAKYVAVSLLTRDLLDTSAVRIVETSVFIVLSEAAHEDGRGRTVYTRKRPKPESSLVHRWP